MKAGFDRNTDFVSGSVLLIDKPLEWSSFDVVKKIRNALCRKLGIRKIKVGHAGTLDPLASGLMILCTGKATKQIESFQELPKEYYATLKLGESTPSFDLETEVDRRYPIAHITDELAASVLESMKGSSMQVPPAFSAKRLRGARAYEYAREGKALKLIPQPVEISELELLDFELPELSIRIRCSKGTYVRSLARDMGEQLGSGAHLKALRRTRIGPYRVEDARSPENFADIVYKM